MNCSSEKVVKHLFAVLIIITLLTTELTYLEEFIESGIGLFWTELNTDSSWTDLISDSNWTILVIFRLIFLLNT